MRDDRRVIVQQEAGHDTIDLVGLVVTSQLQFGGDLPDALEEDGFEPPAGRVGLIARGCRRRGARTAEDPFEPLQSLG